MNQETRHMGFSRAQIHGDPAQRQAAKQLILESLERVQASDAAGMNLQGQQMPFQMGQQQQMQQQQMQQQQMQQQEGMGQEELRVEQRYVGWLLGKQGGVVKEIELASG